MLRDIRRKRLEREYKDNKFNLDDAIEDMT